MILAATLLRPAVLARLFAALVALLGAAAPDNGSAPNGSAPSHAVATVAPAGPDEAMAHPEKAAPSAHPDDAAAIAQPDIATPPVRGDDAVVLNSDDDSLSIINGKTYQETARTHIGRAPHHLIVTPDRKTLIIALSEGNELVFIDLASGMLKQRLAASDPYQIGFSPDGKWFVANSLRLDRIDIYDGKDFHLIHRLPALTMPSHIGFSPDSSTVYVTLQGTKGLTAIDLDTGKTKWTTQVGRQPAGVLVRKSGTILVGVMGTDHIAEVDPQDGHVIRTIHTDRGAHNFLVSADGKTIWVSNRVAGTISVLDADTLNVTGSFAAPGGPDDMALSPDGSELWVTGRWRAAVNVLERTSGNLKRTIAVGRSPHGIFLY